MKKRADRVRDVSPTIVTPCCWFYTERKGLVVVQEARLGGKSSGQHLGTAVQAIPWRLIRKALKDRAALRKLRRKP